MVIYGLARAKIKNKEEEEDQKKKVFISNYSYTRYVMCVRYDNILVIFFHEYNFVGRNPTIKYDIFIVSHIK